VTEVPLDRPLDAAALLRLAAELPPAAPPPTREARLARDPLRFIPAARRDAARGPAPDPERGPFDMQADDPAFCGQGWWQAERTTAGALRWSGLARCATLLLPALGGGALRLTLALRSPFGIPLDVAAQGILLDGAPLTFETLENDGVIGRFAASALLPPLPAFARVALLVQGEPHADPDTSARRDTRLLGIGLMALRLERA
jgi:hypothetical protein